MRFRDSSKERSNRISIGSIDEPAADSCNQRVYARVSLANLSRSSVSYNAGGLAVGFDAFNTSRSKGRASVSYKQGGLAGPDGWLGAESQRGWTQRKIGGVILS